MPVFIFSVLLLAVLVTCGIIGAVRGFVRSIAVFVRYIVAYMLANRFYTLGAALVAKIPFIANMITDVEMPDISEGTGFFERIGKTVSFVAEGIFSGEISSDETVQAIINNYLADIISKAVAFAVIFFAALLILKLAIYLFDKVCDLPGLKEVNKTLGFVFGVLFGLLITWLLANLTVNTILPWLVEKWPDVFTLEMGQTAVVKFFTKYNPVALIMYIVNVISSIGVK